jgi:hypothetical protein
MKIKRVREPRLSMREHFDTSLPVSASNLPRGIPPEGIAALNRAAIMQPSVAVNPVTGILQPAQNVISPATPDLSNTQIFAVAPKYGEPGYIPSVAELQAGYQTEAMSDNELLQSVIQSSKEKAIYTPPGASKDDVITSNVSPTIQNDVVTLADIPHAANMQQVLKDMPNIIVDTNNLVNNGDGATEDSLHQLIYAAPTLNVDDTAKAITLKPDEIKAVTQAIVADPNANVTSIIDNAVTASNSPVTSSSAVVKTSVASSWFDRLVDLIYNKLYNK